MKSRTIRWNCHFFFPSALSVVSFLPLAASSFAKGAKRDISALKDNSSVKQENIIDMNNYFYTLVLIYIPFCSSSLFFAASSLCFRIIASLARSALASSVFPSACNFLNRQYILTIYNSQGITEISSYYYIVHLLVKNTSKYLIMGFCFLLFNFFPLTSGQLCF